MNIKVQKVQYFGALRLHWNGHMDQKDLARVSRALSDPTRLRIFEGLSPDKEMFCGQVVERCGLTPGTISHHLKILADADLIETRREGQFIYMRSRPETIREYGRALAKMAGKTVTRKRKAASSR
jgi:ArsR family transcriptional regulator